MRNCALKPGSLVCISQCPKNYPDYLCALVRLRTDPHAAMPPAPQVGMPAAPCGADAGAGATAAQQARDGALEPGSLHLAVPEYRPRLLTSRIYRPARRLNVFSRRLPSCTCRSGLRNRAASYGQKSCTWSEEWRSMPRMCRVCQHFIHLVFFLNPKWPPTPSNCPRNQRGREENKLFHCKGER